MDVQCSQKPEKGVRSTRNEFWPVVIGLIKSRKRLGRTSLGTRNMPEDMEEEYDG